MKTATPLYVPQDIADTIYTALQKLQSYPNDAYGVGDAANILQDILESINYQETLITPTIHHTTQE